MLPVYAHVLDRAATADLSGRLVRISSTESLVVMKLIASRPQDEADVRDLLAAYRGRLDVDSIKADFATVADPDDQRRAAFERWVKESGTDYFDPSICYGAMGI